MSASKSPAMTTGSKKKNKVYRGDHTAGPDAVVETHPALVVWVLPLPQEVLVAHVIGFLINNPVPTVHPDRVAAAEVGMQVRALTAALERAALEVPVLVEDDLKRETFDR